VVDRLAPKDLVVRTPLEHDRRVVHVGFSPLGQRINRVVVASRHAAAATLLDTLGAPDRAALLTALARLLHGPS
jgi:DNA-binding MarR family transcriptional regulator